MTVRREQVFCPVVVRAVEGFEVAVDETDHSDFGLAAAIFTRDLRAAHRSAEETTRHHRAPPVITRQESRKGGCR